METLVSTLLRLRSSPDGVNLRVGLRNAERARVNSFVVSWAHYLRACLFVLLGFAFVGAAAAETATDPVVPQDTPELGASTYKLGAGDVISIRVYGSPELSFESLRLTDAGTFSFPFLGEIQAAGKTTRALEGILVEGLKGGYFVSPQVSVTLIEYRPFFVKGEVKQPGSYPYQPGLTLRKAITLAGGLTPLASPRRMSIIHESDPDQKPEKATLDTVIMPGDIIDIGQGLF